MQSFHGKYYWRKLCLPIHHRLFFVPRTTRALLALGMHASNPRAKSVSLCICSQLGASFDENEMIGPLSIVRMGV